VSFLNPSDAAVRELLEGARRIAVVGLSPKPWRTSNQIAGFLVECGYEVIPVYPRGDEILGRRVYRSVAEIPGGVDLVDVFRRSEVLDEVAVDAVAAKAPALWFQLGCIHEAAAGRASEAGLAVVMDRCILVEHRRLLGSGWKVPS
jgi:predicted CoA-binding protein